MKTAIFKLAVLCSIALSLGSCKDHEKIKYTEAVVATLQDSIDFTLSQYTKYSTSLDEAKLSEAAHRNACDSLTRAADAYMLDNPGATYYIFRFDQSVPGIIKPYVEANSDEMRDFILLTDFGFWLYGLDNESHIEDVRIALRQYDDQKSQELSLAQQSANQIPELQASLAACQEKMQLLSQRKEATEMELIALNDQGWL